MARLSDYESIVGKGIIDDLRLLGEKAKGRVVQNINSTAVGGGVAEILTRIVPLLGELGVDAKWDVIKGGESFFEVTKKFHNSLHGRKEKITSEMFKVFMENSQTNLDQMDIYGDVVVIHDPQPIVLIKKKPSGGKWVWRCHIDVSKPDQKIWSFLRDFINQYDAAIFSAPIFARKLKVRQFMVFPSIDPLSDKNRDLSKNEIESVLRKYELTQDRPIIAQISRFDHLKDPLGVIEAFRLVRKYNKCQLVLAGNRAVDDPESEEVLEMLKERAANDPDIHILLIPPEENDVDINALQRASSVIVQKSIREGFALTVTEALWKAKPIVASAVGGIPLQVTHKYSGLLCRTIEGAALQIREFLHSPEYAHRLGLNGKEHIRQNFLLTRHLRDYLLLFLALEHPGKDIIRL